MNAQLPNIPAIPNPCPAGWAHEQIEICRQKLYKIELDLEDPRPSKIKLHPQLQAQQQFWINRR